MADPGFQGGGGTGKQLMIVCITKDWIKYSGVSMVTYTLDLQGYTFITEVPLLNILLQ